MLVTLGATLLAGCKVIPTQPVDRAPPPPPRDVPRPDGLPSDSQRHRIALLVPLTGTNAAVGQAIANAATMALLDTSAENLRITNYDTSVGAAAAAERAIADGNRLILGPLMAEDIPQVATVARAAQVPVISYSNDELVASRDTLIMGSIPRQSIARSVGYAKERGMRRFAALVPAGAYGQRASVALLAETRDQGASVAAMETFDRSRGSVTAAATRLRAKGGYEAVLIADGGRVAAQAGPLLRSGSATPRLIGTELWSGEAVLLATPALRGALFAAVPDTRWSQFSASYRTRFGAAPYRLATLGYDSVLLTLRVAREWQPGAPFPTARLFDRGGFLGLDGPFRFSGNGLIERAFEVREVRAGGVTVVSPAPTRFTP